MCPTSPLGRSQDIGGLGSTEGPQTGRSHRQTLSSCRKHQVTGQALAGSHSTSKGCSEFFPFLCHCFTHSQENGLIPLASSMKPSSHPRGWPPSLSLFLWLTSHVGLSLNYSVHHHSGPLLKSESRASISPALHTQQDLKQHLRTNCKNCHALSTLNLTTKLHMYPSGGTQPTSQMKKTEARRGEVVPPTIIANK